MPAKDKVEITFSINEIENYVSEVYSAAGQIAHREKIENAGYYTLYRNNTAAGIYLYRITNAIGKMLDTGRIIWE